MFRQRLHENRDAIVVLISSTYDRRLGRPLIPLTSSVVLSGRSKKCSLVQDSKPSEHFMHIDENPDGVGVMASIR